MEDETRRSNPRQRGGGLALYSNTKSYEREREQTRAKEEERESDREGERGNEKETERGSEKARKRETRRPLHLGEHRRLERNGRSSTQRSRGRRGTAAERGCCRIDVAGTASRMHLQENSARVMRGERERR